MSRRLLRLLAAGGLMALGVSALVAPSQANPLLGLGDPTRPPAGLVKVAPGATPAAANVGAMAAEAASAASAPPPREPQLSLQLVRVDPSTGRGVALINDRLIEPGARIEGWTLVSLGSHEAVLQGPRGRLRLSLMGASQIERNPKSAQSRRGRKE